MTSRIPPLLELSLPALPDETALVLLTSVIGASTNWLVLRQLQSLLLKPKPLATAAATATGAGDGEGQNEGAAVLLVSFLRDFAFWRENLARLGGVDLEALGRRGRFGYVDGLSLFSPGAGAAAGVGWKRAVTAGSGDAVGDVKKAVLEVVDLLKKGKGSPSDEGRKVVLVVDGLDFVLASSPGSAALDARRGDAPTAAAVAVKDMLMDLREVCSFHLP